MELNSLNVPQLRRLAVRVNIMTVSGRRAAKRVELLGALERAEVSDDVMEEIICGRSKLEETIREVMASTLNMGRRFNDTISKPKRGRLPSNYINRVMVDSPSSDTDYIKQLRDKMNERDLPGNKMRYRTLMRNFFRSKGEIKLKWKGEIISFLNLVSPSGMMYGEFPDYPGMFGFYGAQNSDHMAAVVTKLQDKETERESNTINRATLDKAAAKIRSMELKLREGGHETAGEAVQACLKILSGVDT